MEKLKEDLEENRQLRPIIDDGAGDVTLWNKVSRVSGMPAMCGARDRTVKRTRC